MGAGHHHGHDHDHGPVDFDRAFLIGIVLNTAFVAVEAAYGFLANSMALLADAGHNLGDVLGLVVAWIGARLVQRRASPRFTYGLKKSSILAALINALLLLVAVGGIGAEAIRRLIDPEPANGSTVMIVAGIGILVNGLTALLFASGRKGDLNIRGAYLHMLADAAVSAGVVIAGIGITLTGAGWIDPVTSLVITLVIAWGSWGLLRDALRMGLLAVPDGIDQAKVRSFLESQPGVSAVHDLHIWPMSTTENAITAHLVMPGGFPGDRFLHDLAHQLAHDFGIGHPTFQVETLAETGCALESETVV